MYLVSNLLNDGGPLFMYTNLMILIIIIILLAKIVVKQEGSEQAIGIIKHLSIFALVWGFFGQMIGFLDALESIKQARDISHQVLALGLKISLLSPVFGMAIFLVARLGLIALSIIKRK